MLINELVEQHKELEADILNAGATSYKNENNVVTRKTTPGNKHELDETLLFRERVVSFGLGAGLIIDNLRISDDEKEVAKQKILAISDYYTTKLNIRIPGKTLTKWEWARSKAKLKKAVLMMANSLPISEGLFTRRKYLITAEKYVPWELDRPTLKTEQSYNNGKGYIHFTAKPINQLTTEQIKEYENVHSSGPYKDTDWYDKMPQWEQDYIGKKTHKPELLAQTKSANERKTPGLAHYLKHEFQIAPKTKMIHFTSKTITYATPPTIGLAGYRFYPDRISLAEQNIEQLLLNAGIERKKEEFVTNKTFTNLRENLLNLWELTDSQAASELPVPFSIRSLLSPTRIGTFMDEPKAEGEMFHEESFAYNTVKERIKESKESPNIEIYHTNYGVNGYRGLIDSRVLKRNEIEALRIVKNVLQFFKVIVAQKAEDRSTPSIKLNHLLEKVEKASSITTLAKGFTEVLGELNLNAYKKGTVQAENLALIHQTLIAYIDLFNDKGWGNKHNQNLFKASYEGILIDKMGGIDTQHCQSSKDRSPMVLEHRYAIEALFYSTGELLQYRDATNSENRRKFRKIFADIEFTQHFWALAQLTNKGTFGKKVYQMPTPLSLLTLSLFSVPSLPFDIQKELKSGAFSLSKRNATLNHIKPRVINPVLGILGLGIGITTVFAMLWAPAIGAFGFGLLGAVALPIGMGLFIGITSNSRPAVRALQVLAVMAAFLIIGLGAPPLNLLAIGTIGQGIIWPIIETAVAGLTFVYSWPRFLEKFTENRLIHKEHQIIEKVINQTVSATNESSVSTVMMDLAPKLQNLTTKEMKNPPRKPGISRNPDSFRKLFVTQEKTKLAGVVSPPQNQNPPILGG